MSNTQPKPHQPNLNTLENLFPIGITAPILNDRPPTHSNPPLFMEKPLKALKNLL